VKDYLQVDRQKIMKPFNFMILLIALSVVVMAQLKGITEPFANWIYTLFGGDDLVYGGAVSAQ